MRATITTIHPEPRAWGEKWPDACSVEGNWKVDGQLAAWEVKTKTSVASKHIEALTPLVGKEAEFEAEKGQRAWVIKDYPGKTVGKQQQGRREYVPAFHQTAEGVAYEQERMDRRTALMQAVALHNVRAMDNFVITAVADLMYEWLRATADQSSGGAVLKGKAGSTPPEPTSGARAVQERTSVLGNKDTAKSDEGLDRSASEQPPSARTAEPTPATASRTAVPPRVEVSRGAEVSSPPTPPSDYPNFRLPKTAETAELGGYEVKELAETVPDKLEAFLGKGWFTTRQEAIIRFHLDRVKEAAK